MTFKKLAPKNWFGGRVLMPFELYSQQRKGYFGVEYTNRPKASLINKDESEETY